VGAVEGAANCDRQGRTSTDKGGHLEGDRLTYAEIAKLTGADLAARVIAGKVSRRMMWSAFKGAAAPLMAVASGDVASDDVAAARCSLCLSCQSDGAPTTTRGKEQQTEHGIAQAIYCGQMPDGNPHGPNPTCGCLVAITVAGEFIPAGKTLVGSCRCPQGKWLGAARFHGPT